MEIAEGKFGAVMRLIPALELQSSKENLVGAVLAEFESGQLNVAELVDAATGTSDFPLTTRIEFQDGEWDGRECSRQIDNLLDRAVRFGTLAEAKELRFINRLGDPMVIRTCRQYLSAVAAGYFAADNTEYKLSSVLVTASTVLAAASQAQIAAISYLRRPHVGVADLDLLPASILPSIGPRSDGQEQNIDFRNASLGDLVRSKEISILGVSSTHLDVSFNDVGLSLRELLRADLDGDGVEEILVQRRTYIIGATFRSYGVGVLRRLVSDSQLAFDTWEPHREFYGAEDRT